MKTARAQRRSAWHVAALVGSLLVVVAVQLLALSTSGARSRKRHVKISYYTIADQQDFPGGSQVTLYDRSCRVLAKVGERFAKRLRLEGTGRLRDGRLLNVHGYRSCHGRRRVCFRFLSPAFRRGRAASGRPLLPLRTIAVDPAVVAHGAVVFLPRFAGLSIPRFGNLGGFVHDGCFRADDSGGAIRGQRIDIFAGSRRLWRWLERQIPTHSWLRIARGRCKPADR
ncbi:MAG: hypothetical protein H6707_00955 [Deltaproteobacteria bacterium]|nr:hypothetical protein [Deltaproteobacteria bacterium]